MLSVTGGSEVGFGVGEIKYATKDSINENWALCNGDVLLRSEYPELTKKIEGLGMYTHKQDITFSKDISFENSEGTTFTATITEADIMDIYFCEETSEMIVTCADDFKEGTTYYHDTLVILFYKKTSTGDFEFDLENWEYKIVYKYRYYASYDSGYNYKGAITKKINGRYIVLLGKSYYGQSQQSYRADAVFSEEATSIESASTWTFNTFVNNANSTTYYAFLPVLLDSITINGTQYTVFITQSMDGYTMSNIAGAFYIYLIPDFADTSTFYTYGYGINGSYDVVARWFVHNDSLWVAYGTYNNAYYYLWQFTVSTSALTTKKSKNVATNRIVNPSGVVRTSFAFYEGTAGLYIFMNVQEYSSGNYYELGYFLIDSSETISGAILTTDLWVNGVFDTDDGIMIYTNNGVYTVASESDLTDFSKWVEVGFTYMPYSTSAWENTYSSLYCSAKILKGTDGTAKIIPTPYIYFRDNFILEHNKYIKLPTLVTDATISPYPQYFMKIK